eukprot:COSAG02_NODE_4622_length_5153_cov_9.543926_2_plen_531_part_00
MSPKKQWRLVLVAWLTIAGTAVAVALTPTQADALTSKSAWRQDVFTISEWQAPRAFPGADWLQDATKRYKEFAEANFTVMLGGLSTNATRGTRLCQCTNNTEPCCGHTAEAIQMRLCEANNLKCVPGLTYTKGCSPLQRGRDGCHGKPIRTPQKIDPAATSSSAFWGFDLADEPKAEAFSYLGTLATQVAELYPKALRFVNLYPDYATQPQLNATNYSTYVNEFVKQVNPDVVSMDHYPVFEMPDSSGCYSRAGYRAGLGVLRQATLATGVPFWNFFNTMPFSGRSDPTEAQLAWQIFTSLAYGAKGILYYCYWSPAGQGTKYYRGGGVVYPQGTLNISNWTKIPDISLTSSKLYRRGAHYRHAQRLNSIVRNWGRPQYLLNAKSTGVYRAASASQNHRTIDHESGDPFCSAAGPQPSHDLSSCAINNVSDVAVSSRVRSSFDNDHPGEGMLIGQFELEDGRTALLLHNHNPDFTIWPTLEFSNAIDPQRDVFEVDPISGIEAPLLDDSPLMEGTQLSFEAGMARFLVLR